MELLFLGFIAGSLLTIIGLVVLAHLSPAPTEPVELPTTKSLAGVVTDREYAIEKYRKAFALLKARNGKNFSYEDADQMLEDVIRVAQSMR